MFDRCDLPEGYDVGTYEFFQGKPAKILTGGETIDLGGRLIKVIHTPGHSPGHMCFWEPERGYLFTGDLIYKGMLLAFFPSTDPQAYLQSLEALALLPAKRLFPGHHSLAAEPELCIRMRDKLRQLKAENNLRHGRGVFQYGDWSIRL